MNNAIYRINLDVQTSTSQIQLRASKGDTGRAIEVCVADGVRSYEITDDCSAVLRSRTPSGTIVSTDCTIADNVISAQLSDSITESVGTVECDIVLSGDDSAQLTLPKFFVIVEDTLSVTA